jgi:hypothetical protein
MGGQYTSSLSKFTTHIVALNMENVSGRYNSEYLEDSNTYHV